MSEERKELMQQVAFGIEVEAFLQGPIGRHLIARLREEEAHAAEELKTVNPRELERIIELQLIIKRATQIDNWLAAVIQEGWSAEDQLKGEEQ